MNAQIKHYTIFFGIIALWFTLFIVGFVNKNGYLMILGFIICVTQGIKLFSSNPV